MVCLQSYRRFDVLTCLQLCHFLHCGCGGARINSHVYVFAEKANRSIPRTRGRGEAEFLKHKQTTLCADTVPHTINYRNMHNSSLMPAFGVEVCLKWVTNETTEQTIPRAQILK